MTLPQIISRNQTQKIPETPITGRVVLQPNTWYTCPAGKKARIKGTILCTGLGAAGTADLLGAGDILFRWDRATAIIRSYFDFPRVLTTANGGQMAEFEIDLAAGEILETVQDSGTNAEFNMNAKVQETPI